MLRSPRITSQKPGFAWLRTRYKIEGEVNKRQNMDKRLTQEQLAQVIAEVDRLSRRREAEVDRAEVQQILQELNLSPELLDDALVQVERQEALAVQQQRRKQMLVGAIAFLVVAIAGTVIFLNNRQQTFTQISAYSSAINLEDSSANLKAIDRQTNPKVYYRVTLNNAPIGEKLSLTCDWIDPENQVAHQSRYQTRSIDRSTWSTYCFYQFNSASKAGSWQVQMSLEGRPLSKTFFTVQ